MAHLLHRTVVEIQFSTEEALALKDFLFESQEYPNDLKSLIEELEENL